MGEFGAADAIGSFGVFLLLSAFALNLLDVVDRQRAPYLIMNFLGAGLATIASWMIGYMPFVVLEGVWSLVSAIALFRTLRSL